MTHFWNLRLMRCLRSFMFTLNLTVAASCALMTLAHATSTTYNGSGSQTWKAPAGVTSITVEAWGAGGAGGGATANPAQGGGGAGGQYVRKVVTVVPGTNYTVVIGAGGNGGTGNGAAGGDSTFAGAVVVAKGGAGGTNAANGVAGLGSITGGVGDVVYAGGNGSNGDTTNLYGAGGGGAGSTGAGGAAVGRTGGIGTASGGGDGGNGRNSRNDGRNGSSAGGGGGGGYTNSNSDKKGGDGGDGMVTISYANLPSATTNVATAIGPNGATLNGAVTSNDGVTTVTFEYGLTTSYGTTGTASQSPLAFDAAAAAVSAVISGLAQSTTYHFRVKAQNSAGTVYGADRTFTTSGPPVVNSINRANFDPTAANTVVAWTVVFDRSVTGVDAADFSLIQAGGATGASITSVTGSGTAWTVTGNTGTGTAGTVQLDLIDNDTIVSGGVPLGGAGLGNGSFVGQTYTIVTVCTNTAPQIFCDDFERSNAGAVGAAPFGYGSWTVTPANTSTSCSGGTGNTGCAGIDSDIPPFNTYTNPRANATRSMFTRWSTLTVDSPTINLAGRPAALLSFWMRRGSDGFSECPEAVGENYLVQFWDGAAWQILAQYPSSPSASLCGAGEVWTPVIQLPPAALHSGFKLRFAQPSGSGKSGSGGAAGVVGYDYWHLDNVLITEAPASSYSGPFCDNFEGGLGRWSITAEGAPAGSGSTAGLEIGDARLGTGNANSASTELDMRWGYVVASTLRTDMTGVTGNINYWLKSGTSTRDPASGENLVVEYFNNAGVWTTLATYLGTAAAGTVYNGSHVVPADAKHAGFRLRFRLLAGSGFDLSYWHLDDVCVGTIVPTADLSIAKTRSGAPLVPGTNVPYTITVTNNGPGALAGTLQVVDTLPAGLSLFTFFGTGWSCSASGQVVTCSYLPGTLASGATAPALTITAAVALSATGTLVNSATVSGAVVDGVPGNNTATDSGTILEATLVAEYHMEDASWGVLKDTAGFAGGPFNGSSTGSPVPLPAFSSPALGTVPGSGTCGYASLSGPLAGGGALTSASSLPLITSPGVKTSVAFWMYWDGTSGSMPIGWSQYALLLQGGSFGFTTTGSDIYGIASTGLATGWHHVAAVFTNGSVVDNLLYVDGVLKALTQRVGTPTLANAVVSTTLTIGGWGSTTGFRFTGRLDEVKVYKDVLVQSDVTAIYAETHTCVAAVDHVRIEHDGQGLTCRAESVTVKACSSADSGSPSSCTLYSGGISGNLLVKNGSTVLATVPFAIPSGSSSATVSTSVASAPGVTFETSALSITPGGASAWTCWNSATTSASCSMAVAACVGGSNFNCLDNSITPYSLATARLYTKLAGTPFNFDVVALDASGAQETNYAVAGGATRQVTVELFDNTTPAGTCGAYSGPLHSQVLTMDASRKQIATVTLAPAYRKLMCRVTDTSGASPVFGCSSDDFSVRPSAATLITTAIAAAPSASATPTIKAGSNFSLSATTSAGAGYAGSLALDTDKLTAQDPTALVQQSGGWKGTLTPGSLTANAAAANATYSEVGYLYLAPGAYRDEAFTAVDSVTGDCITSTASDNNLADTVIGGKYGCHIGNKIGVSLGRFIPDHFDVSVNSSGSMAGACLAGSFTYTGQVMGYGTAPSLTIKPMNAASGGSVTQNYRGHFQKLVATDVAITTPTADATRLGVDGTTKTLVSASMTTGTLGNSSGTMTYTLNASDQFTYTRNANALVAAYTNAIPLTATAIAESEVSAGGSLLPLPQTFSPTGVSLRYGRARMLNGYGSELLDLPIVFRTEYLSSSAPTNVWSLNSADSCTNATVAFAQAGATNVTSNTCVLEPGNNSGKGCAVALTPAQTNRRYLETGVIGTDSGGVTGFAGNFNLWLKATGSTHPGSIDITATVDSWLQYPWSGSTATSPTARATFGIFKSPLIYRRENY